MHGTVTRAATLKVGYFAQHQLDELDRGRQPLRSRAPADAGSRRKPKCAARVGAIGFSGLAANQRGEDAFRRREVAAAAGPGDLRRAASRHPRRADQPSRHRQPRRADRGDQRLSRRGDPGVARPLSAGSLRRPALAGGRRQGHSRSTAISTITGAWCSPTASAGRAVGSKSSPRADPGRGAPRRRRQARGNRAVAQADRAGRSRDRAADAPAPASSTPRSPTALCSRAIRRAPPSFPRRARRSWPRLPRRKRNGSPPARRLRPRELDCRSTARKRGRPRGCAVFGFAGFFAALLFRRRLGRGRRLGRAVDRLQPAGVESVDAGPRTAQIGQHDLAVAFVAGADVDVARPARRAAPRRIRSCRARRRPDLERPVRAD